MAALSPISLLHRLWSNHRSRIVLTSLLVGVLFGVTKLGLPIEDIFYTLRTSLRHEVASQDIVVVKIDDRTLKRLEGDDSPRDIDAVVVDKIVAAGAKRIVFDRAYSYLENPQSDQRLAESLKAHPGKIFMGAMYDVKKGASDEVSLLPTPMFRPHVGIVSLVGFIHPFKLNVSFPFKSETAAGTVPSMSAMLADLEELPEGYFRPDYAIDVTTIPQYSFIDVLENKVPASAFNGRDVVIAPTALNYNDLNPMPSQGFVSGGFFHVVGAITLKRHGVPLDLGWFVPFLLVLGVIATGFGHSRTSDRYRLAGVATVVVFLPFILDRYAMHVEIVPAVMTAGIAMFRARSLDRVELASKTNAGSGLPSVQALRELAEVPKGILVAIKIRNYGSITGSFAQPVEARLAEEIVRRIRISDPNSVVYHEADMFLWISPLTNPVDVSENLEGLHKIVQNGLRIEDRDIDLSFNCGLESNAGEPIASRIANAKQSAEEAVRMDEIVHVYDSANRETHWEISLLTSLDRAIDNGEVWVAYQPKLDLRSGTIKGAEALVRWTHPDRGPISPEQFVRLAEEYHRIERLTRFVLDDAVRSAAMLLREGYDFTVSVNIAAQLLRNASLPGMIFEALETHGLSPERLILEITETDRFERSSRTIDVLKRFVDAGLQISIDDFGTGNATIDYLRFLPASEVKIDKAFVQGMEHSREDLLLVQSIIDMAHSLDRRVVAEGAESEEIIDKLRSMNCDQVQGFWIGEPLSVSGIKSLLGGWSRISLG